MKNNKKFFYTIMLLFWVIGIFSCVLLTDKVEYTDFLDVYGEINYTTNKPVPLTLAIISGKDSEFDINDIEVRVDNKNITIENVVIEKAGDTFKYVLWYLYFDVNISKSSVSEKIKTVTLNGKEYDIGNLTFNKVNSANLNSDSLKLTAHMATSLGTGLSKYYAMWKNDGCKNILVKDFYASGYELATSYYIQNSKEIDDIVILSPNDEIETGLRFDSYAEELADVYYVSPIILYQIDGREYIRVLPYYTSGLNLSKVEINEIGDRMFKETNA